VTKVTNTKVVSMENTGGKDVKTQDQDQDHPSDEDHLDDNSDEADYDFVNDPDIPHIRTEGDGVKVRRRGPSVENGGLPPSSDASSSC